MAEGETKKELPAEARGALEHLRTFEIKIQYDKSVGWDTNVRLLIEKAMGNRADKYKTKMYWIEKEIERKSLDRHKNPHTFDEKIASIELRKGSIIFKDAAGKELVDPMDITDAMEDMIDEAYGEAREKCLLHTRRTLDLEYNRIRNYESLVLQARATAAEAMPVEAAPTTARQEGALASAATESAGAAQAPATGPAAAASRPGAPATAPSATPSSASASRPATRPVSAPTEKAPPAATMPSKFTEQFSRDREELERAKFLADKIGSREKILSSAMEMEDSEYSITAQIDAMVQDADSESFEAMWRDLLYSDQVNDLLTDSPRGDYKFNPFKSQKWNHETLRQLMQNGSQAEIDFREVAEKIYNDRYEDFKKNLALNHVPEEITDLLDKETGWAIGSQDDDLIRTYSRLNRLYCQIDAYGDIQSVPANLKSLYRNREHLKYTVQALGDYIAYATKLIRLINKMRYRPLPQTRDRAASAFELAEGKSEQIRGRNRVVLALRELFITGVQEPREYTSEFSYLLSSNPGRRINFMDLNENVATVEPENGDWSTIFLSPKTAYLNAFEASESLDENGCYTESVDEKASIKHLNYLLQLGISAYNGISSEGVKGIINNLQTAGVRKTGDSAKDARNLYSALEVCDLFDLTPSSPQKQLLCAERKKLIRAGSVVYHNMKERKGVEAAKRAVSLKLTPKQAEEIVAILRDVKPPKFTEAQLTKFKQQLIGGAIVALPKAGGVIDAHLVFGENQDVSLDITGAFPGWESFAAGAAVGKRFVVSQGMSVSVSLGAGYNFSNPDMAVGGGFRITQKIGKVNAYFEAGAGGLVEAGLPVMFAGLGINRNKTLEKYQDKLTAAEAQNHVKELDAAGDRAFDSVKEDPSKYPELARILYRIQALEVNEESQRKIFKACYEMFKEGLDKKAFDESDLKGWDRFVGFGGGIALGPAFVAPYAYIEFKLWSRALVFRTTTGEEKAEAAANAVITAQMKEKTECKEIGFSPETIKLKGELLRDANGNLMLKDATEVKLDLRHLERLADLKKALGEGAKIAAIKSKIDGKDYGLIELRPQEAHGNMEVYIDPALKDDVVLVTRGSKLYMSVKNNREIYVRREDLKYPFEQRSESERTRIVVSASPELSIDDLRNSSQCFLERHPKTVWGARPAPGADRGITQDNIKNWNEFVEWWGKGRTDRLAEVDTAKIQEAYSRLIRSVEISPDQALSIRPDVRAKIEAFSTEKLSADDKKFLTKFKNLSTEIFPFHREKKGRIPGRNLETQKEIDLSPLLKLINEKFSPDGKVLSAEELSYGLYVLTTASFLNIQTKKSPQKSFEYFNEIFQRPMLTSIFKKHFNGDEAKTAEAVSFIMEKFKDTDVSQAGEKLGEGFLFASLVGTEKITGLRYLYNYKETDPRYGVLGRMALNLNSANATEKEIARFWFETLSPYKLGAHEAEPFNRDEIYKNLGSPLAVRMVPAIGAILTPEEMGKLTEVYENRRNGLNTVGDANIAVIKKFLSKCADVRRAQLEGKSEVQLNENYKLLLGVNLSMGVYKKCGNITGLLNEEFALVHIPTKRVATLAGMSEQYLKVSPEYSRVNFNLVLGAAIPLRTEQAGRRISEGKPVPPKIPPEGAKIPVPGDKPGVNLAGGGTTRPAPGSPTAGGEGGI